MVILMSGPRSRSVWREATEEVGREGGFGLKQRKPTRICLADDGRK